MRDACYEDGSGLEGVAAAVFPAGFDARTCDPVHSGKMAVLDRVLAWMRANTDDRIVIVSNYTQTLDLLEAYCRRRGYRHLRLDGSRTIRCRKRLVDQFNDAHCDVFVFLLSSKAGGCGLNLIGANRLVLFDPDWNPASDHQAMARIWRDGQRKRVYIYRLVTTGTIEEKILQRQAHKVAISRSVVDAERNVSRHFSLDELRQLFRLNAATHSDTHDAIECRRCVGGRMIWRPPTAPSSPSELPAWLADEAADGGGEGVREDAGTVDDDCGATPGADIATWDHFVLPRDTRWIADPALRAAIGAQVSFVFHRQVGV